VTGPLRVAAVMVAAEGALLVALALAYAGYTLAHSPGSLGVALFSAALALGTGVVLLALARGLARRRAAALSPTLLIQVLALPVGVDQVRAGLSYVGVPVLLLAASVLALLATPAARGPLGR
jgi:hypothetical protein